MHTQYEGTSVLPFKGIVYYIMRFSFFRPYLSGMIPLSAGCGVSMCKHKEKCDYSSAVKPVPDGKLIVSKHGA